MLAFDGVRDPRVCPVVGEVLGDHRRAAELPRERIQAILPAGNEDQTSIGFTREQPRGRLADPARGARDQRDERHQLPCLWRAIGEREHHRART